MSVTSEDDVSIPKPKSTIEARREARIKKILENSKSRLDKLNGEVPKIKTQEDSGESLKPASKIC